MDSKAALLPREDPNSQEAKATMTGLLDDLQQLSGLQLAFMVPFFIISLYSLVTTVHSSATMYHDKFLTLGAMLSEIKWVWKRPIITMIYIGLFTFAYVFTVVFFMIVSMVIIKGATEVALIVVMALLATLYYLHLLAVWTIGLVVSVIEEDCYGMDAIKKASELIKGRRLQGFALMIISSVVSSVVVAIVNHTPLSGLIARRVVKMTVAYLFKLLVFVVFTVFYYDCKRSHGEVVVVPGMKGWRMQSKQLVHKRESHVCRVLVNAKASPGKKKPNEVIMVDPLEAKRLAAKQMEELQAKERLKRRRQIEAINGAWAMIGLTAGLVIEGQTGNNILNQVGAN
ncbi:hypothetical protein QJS10_CPA02g01419 [Acorus calamus]|uniref:Transmembrane protein n=1 Tax=Acorus calamus TaxID=4465 RepID=A0AAV9FD13_ACOCL|nr:hypothetical protein QJS10_CPA02g01419 [Acorus calamus]